MEHRLERFNDDLHLPLLATRFWLRKTRPAEYIKEAIVSILSDNVRSHRDARERGCGPFLIDVAHAYAEWQSCLVSAHDLNLILGSPLPELRTDILPNGSDLHRLANALKHGYRYPRGQRSDLVASFLGQ